MNLVYLIKKPVVTEKSMTQIKEGKYVFEVAVSATKSQIKKMIENQFKVSVIKVRTMIKKSVTKNLGRKRIAGLSAKVKKAMVELKKGQTIKALEIKG